VLFLDVDAGQGGAEVEGVEVAAGSPYFSPPGSSSAGSSSPCSAELLQHVDAWIARGAPCPR
jgi:hypothetical protein